MLNDIGVNLIQVESNTAPLVEPVEIGVLGIAGRFYRGTKLMRLRGAGEDLISNIYKRLGTPFENFRNHAYYSVLGHVQNSVTYGSSLVIHRLRGNNARVARTYTNLTVDSNTGERTYTSHASPTVMRLSSKEIQRTEPYYISHSFDSNTNLYNFEARRPIASSRTIFNVGFYLDSSYPHTLEISMVGNVFTYDSNGQKQSYPFSSYLNQLSTELQNRYQDYAFLGFRIRIPSSLDTNSSNIVTDQSDPSAISSIDLFRNYNSSSFSSQLSIIQTSDNNSTAFFRFDPNFDFRKIPIDAIFVDSNNVSVEIPLGIFFETFIISLSSLNSSFSFFPVSSNSVYPPHSAICFNTGLLNGSASFFPIEVCFYTNAQGAVSRMGLKTTSTYQNFIESGSSLSQHAQNQLRSLFLTNFTISNGIYQSGSVHIDKLFLEIQRYESEIYRTTSLSSLAFALNNGEPVERQVTSDGLMVYSGSFLRNLMTSVPSYFFNPLTQPYIPVETNFVGASRFISCEFVTQSSTVPIENISSAVWHHNIPNYNINLSSSFSNAATFYFSAAQQNEDDWGSWGNNLSVVISPSKIDPTFRRLTVYLRSEGVKRVVEEIEDTEKSILSYLRGSGYVKLNLSSENNFSFMPFIPNLELTLMDGDDGVFNKATFLGSVQDSTGAYIFAGTNATSITCPEVTCGISGLSSNDVIEIIDSYASVALTSNKTAIFTLPRNISRDEIFSTYTRQFLKERSNLILYRANGAVSDGRGGRINTSLVGHIHGAAFVRWRLSQSTFPNIVPKGDPTYLNGVFSLDKEVYSKTEITDYVRVLGINPVALTGSGFTIEGARTMSRKNVHYSIHTTELTNFYVDSISRFASFLKSEFNDEVSQKKFAQRVTDFTRVMYDARCLETDGGFNNNFQIKVDSSVNPIESRRKRIFNARIKIRWIEQIEAINIFFEKTDESVNVTIG